MIIRDWICLGTTVPEPDSKDNIGICSAGYSEIADGLMRIYPWKIENYPKRWSKNRVDVERHPRDSRKGTWISLGDPEPVGKVNKKNLVDVLNRFTVPSIDQANEDRKNLAVVHPDKMKVIFEENDNVEVEYPWLSRMDSGITTPLKAKERYPFKPRIEFELGGRIHRLQIRDWGAWEWMRKYPERLGELSVCLHLKPSSSLLIGNFREHPTSWLIITVMNGLREGTP